MTLGSLFRNLISSGHLRSLITIALLSFIQPAFGQNTVLVFDGVDDWVEVGNQSQVNITGKITLEAWIKPNASQSRPVPRIIDKFVWTVGGYALDLKQDAGDQILFDVYFTDGSEGGVLGGIGSAIYDGNWHHVAATYDGTIMRMYVDFCLKNETSFPGKTIQTVSNPLRIGGNFDGVTNWYYRGGISHARVWNVARTQSELIAGAASVPPSSTGLVVDYKFTEGTGFTTQDASPNNLTAQLGTSTSSNAQAPTWLTNQAFFTPAPSPTISSFAPNTGVSGTPVTITGTNFDPVPANNIVKFNGVAATVTASTATTITATVPAGAVTGSITATVGCYTATSATNFTIDYVPLGNTITLNGSTDFVQINADPALQPVNVTLSTWVKFTSLPASGFAPMIAKVLGTGINDSYVIWYLSGTLRAQVNNTALSNTPVQITWTPVLGKWYNVAFTFDNATKKQTLYVDGLAVVSNTAVAAADYDANPVLIGADIDNGVVSSSPVVMDEVRIWNIALTAGQIQSTMGASLAGNEAGLVGYYRMDETGQGAGIAALNSASSTASNGITHGQTCTPLFTPSLAPTITSFSPASGSVAALVTITGTGFSTVPANNIVKFNGVNAVVATSSPGIITVAVPAGATTGTISIVGCNGTGTSVTNFTVIPAAITTLGMRLWLRADDIGLPDSSPISVWSDASGLGHHFTGVGSSRPLYKNNGCPSVIKGKPYVSYEVGTNLYMSRGDVLGIAPNTPRTFIAIYRMLNPAARAFPVEQGDWTTDWDYIGMDANTWMTQGNRFGAYALRNSYDANLATDTLYHLQQLTAKTMAIGANIAGDLEYRVDDNILTLTGRDLQTGGNYVSFAAANEMRINGNVNIAEIIVYDRVLTNAERLEIVAYLRGKYSLVPVLPPTVTSYNVSTGAVGTSVTITGTNFDPVLANNVVTFAGTPAVVTAGSTTSLTVTVPAGAVSGKIRVAVGCLHADGPVFLVPTGDKLIYYSRTDGNIYATKGDGSADVLITSGYWPKVSVTGRYMLFHRGAAVAISQKNMFTRDLISGSETQVFTNGDFQVYYSWSPDESKIYFDYGCNLWVMNRDGTGMTSIQGADCYDDSPSIRASDGKIVFHHQTGLVLINNDGSARTAIPNTAAGDFYPSWSPDGQWITFSHFTGSTIAAQYKIKEDGSGLTQLTDLASGEVLAGGVDGTEAAWTNDGLNVILPGVIDCRAGLFLIPADGSKVLKRIATTFTTANPEWVGSVVGNPVLSFIPLYKLPTVTSFLPAGGPVGTTVTITGTNFSTTLSDNIVKFNGTTAVVTASTTTMITATVPVGATTGTIAVTVLCNTVASTGIFSICTSPSPPTASDQSRCGNGNVLLTASGAVGAQEYRWYMVSSGGASVNSAAAFNPSVAGTTSYYVSVIETAGGCESTRTMVTATIIPLPPAPVVLGGYACAPSGTITLRASGGAGGQYSWYDVSIGGSAISEDSVFVTPEISTSNTYYVTINNGTCESVRVPALAEIKSCLPEITTATLTTVIGGSATLDLVPLITTLDGALDISSVVVVTQPASGAIASIVAGSLRVDYSAVSFAGRETVVVRACDVAGHCSEQTFTVEVDGDIEVFNALSPNGDDKNNIFIIQNIESLPDTRDNHVSIFNRWGDTVFEVDNYDNSAHVFTGLNKNGDVLSSGTYFYRIDFKSGLKARTGFIELRH